MFNVWSSWSNEAIWFIESLNIQKIW